MVVVVVLVVDVVVGQQERRRSGGCGLGQTWWLWLGKKERRESARPRSRVCPTRRVIDGWRVGQRQLQREGTDALGMVDSCLAKQVV